MAVKLQALHHQVLSSKFSQKFNYLPKLQKLTNFFNFLVTKTTILTFFFTHSHKLLVRTTFSFNQLRKAVNNNCLHNY